MLSLLQHFKKTCSLFRIVVLQQRHSKYLHIKYINRLLEFISYSEWVQFLRMCRRVNIRISYRYLMYGLTL